jgi:hypothetical protein
MLPMNSQSNPQNKPKLIHWIICTIAAIIFLVCQKFGVPYLSFIIIGCATLIAGIFQTCILKKQGSKAISLVGVIIACAGFALKFFLYN